MYLCCCSEGEGRIRAEREEEDFEKFRSLIVETVDLILREEEKKGISVTQADLLKWAKRLEKKEARHENALAIFRWMDSKKMTFSPSDLELYLRVILKVEGLDAAQDCFDKVDPNFDNMDPNSGAA
ncbi:hypothetical protein AALP_AA1G128000 [Arabis alpina]|uniref:Pentacotripeptide-repeat region of PRORP domain-containing protein n=1 Tax=Arabis alpina TaxID=50452 RepID=A0A087HMV7_ARAAL|nr:hypothetical protein AALP_AA1G128000 [Arabis alpina]